MLILSCAPSFIFLGLMSFEVVFGWVVRIAEVEKYEGN
jgi:hypothetical protein